MTPRDYTVLVTGFGANANAPYGNASSNPASMIAEILPLTFAADHPLNASQTNINIMDGIAGGFSKIPGIMSEIRSVIKQLHQSHGDDVDLWLHLGRGPLSWMTCERKAFRQDFSSTWLAEEAKTRYYSGPDNTGQNVHGMGPNPWLQVPMGLDSELDIDSVVAHANQRLQSYKAAQPPLKVRPHLEAGDKGCGFAFYESMANCYIAGRRRDVIFVHVPPHTDTPNLERARDGLLAIIGGAVTALVDRSNRASEPDKIEKFGLLV